jgi:hypothetical protein
MLGMTGLCRGWLARLLAATQQDLSMRGPGAIADYFGLGIVTFGGVIDELVEAMK